MSSVRNRSKFVNRDFGIQPYRSSKSFAQQMRKTTEKALDDVSVRAQSELVRPYLATRYEEHEYEATAPSGETSIDLTIPDIAWATIPIIAAQFKVATPLFSVSSGTYSSAQTVQILCATSGATIYYTLNNTEPNENSTKYTSAITISTTATVRAKAFKAGWTKSETATVSYVIQQWGIYFDNTFWALWDAFPDFIYGSWDGSKWVAEATGRDYQVKLRINGLPPNWATLFRPSQIKLTFTGASTVTISAQSKGSTYEISQLRLTHKTAGDTFTISDIQFHINESWESQLSDWTATVGSWNGSAWVSATNAGLEDLVLSPSGSWKTGYFPDFIRVTTNKTIGGDGSYEIFRLSSTLTYMHSRYSDYASNTALWVGNFFGDSKISGAISSGGTLSITGDTDLYTMSLSHNTDTFSVTNIEFLA